MKHAPPRRFLDRIFHGFGYTVAVKNDFRIDVAGRAANGLNQRGFAAQKPRFVGVEDRDQRDFREIQAFTQQVDADERLNSAQP